MIPRQETSCSHNSSMGASDSNKQASEGRKPKNDYFLKTTYKELSAYLMHVLQKTSEETRAEIVDQIDNTDIEDVDVEGFCRSFEGDSQ